MEACPAAVDMGDLVVRKPVEVAAENMEAIVVVYTEMEAGLEVNQATSKTLAAAPLAVETDSKSMTNTMREQHLHQDEDSLRRLPLLRVGERLQKDLQRRNQIHPRRKNPRSTSFLSTTQYRQPLLLL